MIRGLAWDMVLHWAVQSSPAELFAWIKVKKIAIFHLFLPYCSGENVDGEMIPPCKGISWLLLLWEVDAGVPTLTCIAVFPADLKPSTMNCSNVGSLVTASDSFGFA